MTRVLVTGAAGFIGVHVVRSLAARGCKVVAIARPGASWERAGAAVIHECDLETPGAAAALVARERPELLVHLAWHASPEQYLTSSANLASLGATCELVAQAVASSCRRVIGVGTCLEYASSPRPHRESDPVGPDTLYAACKHAARTVVEQLSYGAGASFAWARLFHLHGPGEDPRRLVPMVAGKLRRNETADLSPGEQVRDYLRVEDVADAVAAIAISSVNGTVNVCSGQPIRVRELLEAVGDCLGRRDLLRFGSVPYRENERMVIVGEPTMLGALGWRPRHAGLRAALSYLAEAAR
jgi:dTDP-6-deoxy-L-talose 4-dehydrogenase (NAD+)